MNNRFFILIFAMFISVFAAYLLVFNPQKNARLMVVVNLLIFRVKQAFLIILTGISTIPSILIIQDRWLRPPGGIQNLGSYWWNVFVKLPSGYPLFFIIIFGLVICIWPFAFLWQQLPESASSDIDLNRSDGFRTEELMDEVSRKTGNILLWSAVIIASTSAVIAFITARIPGWELILALGIYFFGWLIKEYGYNKARQYFVNHASFLIDVTLFVISFCGILYVAFGETHNLLIFYVIFFLASLNLYQKKTRLSPIFWISIVSLAALTWKINGWEYVSIGDEYEFYYAIRDVLDNRTTWELTNTTFVGNFVYGAHPYFSSYIHNFFMKIFGDQNFGWRFSNPFLVASSLFFFHYFFEYFTQKRTALITITLLGFSHYLLSFSKIGYNNLQALFALGLVMAVFTWSLKSMRMISFSCLGLAMGVCFYVYPAALYILPLPVLGLLIYLPPVNQALIKRWAWVFFSCLLAIYPLFIQPKYWQEKIPGTFLFTQAGNSGAKIIQNMTSNILYSLFSYLYMPEEGHYVSSGYLDPLSSIFVIFGSAAIIRMIFTGRKSALFLFLGFASLLILVGVTHGRNFPTTTRMFLLLPWFCLFAAYGMEWMLSKFSLLFNFHKDLPLTLILGAIILLNFYNAYSIDIYRSAQYHNTQSLFIKTARLIDERKDVSPKSYYFLTEEYWNIEAIKIHQRVYQVPKSPNQIINLYLENDQFIPGTEEIVRDADTVIIIRAHINSNTMEVIDTQLYKWGKLMCEIKNEQGMVQFQLWHSGDLQWLCET